MSENMNKKIMKFSIIIFSLLCIVSMYFYLTRPIGLNDLIKESTIKEIHILTCTSPNIEYKFPDELNVDNTTGINAIFDILNNYKYSRILKLYNPRVTPANPTNGAINIFISYTNSDGEFRQQYLFVDSENDVVIRNNNGVNVEYKISGLDENLFESLSSWLSLK